MMLITNILWRAAVMKARAWRMMLQLSLLDHDVLYHRLG